MDFQVGDCLDSFLSIDGNFFNVFILPAAGVAPLARLVGIWQGVWIQCLLTMPEVPAYLRIILTRLGFCL